MKRALVTAPAAFLTPSEVKDRIRVDFDDDDADITRMIAEAVDLAQNYTGRDFLTQAWDYYFDAFESTLEIPVSPLQSVDSVKHYDADDVLQTVNASDYHVDAFAKPVTVKTINGWPATYSKPNAVEVRVTTGWTNVSPDFAPESLKTGVKLIVGHLYDGTFSDMPPDVRAFLDTWRVCW